MESTRVLISLDDPRAKYISEVISNKSCKKIIDYLAVNTGTVTDISKELKMPINTVDYNIKKLLKSGLVEKQSYWWSVKGKKMPIYRVSEKQVVLVPRPSVQGKLKYLYAFIFTGIISLILKVLSPSQPTQGVEESAALFASERALDTAVMITEPTSRSDMLSSIAGSSDLWLWFLVGAWFTIFLFFAANIIQSHFRK